MIAAYFGHATVVKFLLEAGAEVVAMDSDGWTAIDLARSQDHGNIVEVLDAHLTTHRVTDETWREGAERTVVAEVDVDFAAIDPDKTLADWQKEFYGSMDYSEEELREVFRYRAAESVLWNLFANKPAEMQFAGVSTENWYEKWSYYRQRMLEMAHDAGFPAMSLDQCIETVAPMASDGTALLPVGAYLARSGDKDVWIVVCKWEYADYTDDEGNISHSSLGHIMGWAIDAISHEEICFFTCD